MVFLKDIFEKVNVEKKEISRREKYAKVPSMQKVKTYIDEFECSTISWRRNSKDVFDLASENMTGSSSRKAADEGVG